MTAPLKCFACGRRLGKRPLLVTCEDEQDVFVGSECAKEVARAGAAGWRPPKGGPVLYLIEHDPKGANSRWRKDHPVTRDV